MIEQLIKCPFCKSENTRLLDSYTTLSVTDFLRRDNRLIDGKDTEILIQPKNWSYNKQYVCCKCGAKFPVRMTDIEVEIIKNE